MEKNLKFIGLNVGTVFFLCSVQTSLIQYLQCDEANSGREWPIWTVCR